MQKNCSHCTTIWGKYGDIMCLEMIVKNRQALSFNLNVGSVTDDVTS